MRHKRTERRVILAGVLLLLVCGGAGLQGQKSSAPKLRGQTKAGSAASTSMAAAKAQVDGGDLSAGENTLWSILSSQPDNQDALTMLGVVRGRQGRHPEAEALFRRVLQLNQKSAVASRNLAMALLAQNRPEEAIRQYNQAIQLSPRDSGLRIELARLELEHGNFAGALSALEGIGDARLPTSAVPLKAAALLGANRRADAEALIPQVKASPADVLDLATVFVEANDSVGALKTLGLLNPVPKSASARVHYLKGRALRQQGGGAAAMASFRQALASDPKSAETLVAMAEAFASQNKHADSLAMLEKARAVSPDSKEVLRHVIVEAMRAGQNERGLEAAQELQRKSSELDDRYLVASVMVQQKQFLSASHILEDYVAQRPEDAKAYLGLGMAYLSLLRYAEARSALEHALRIDPSLAEAWYQLGLLAGQRGDSQEAIQDWKKAVALKPDHGQALFSLGITYLESGELADAESSLRRSLAVDPGSMKTEYDLALVLNKLGKRDEAKQHFERYRTLQEAEHATAGDSAAAPSRQ